MYICSGLFISDFVMLIKPPIFHQGYRKPIVLVPNSVRNSNRNQNKTKCKQNNKRSRVGVSSQCTYCAYAMCVRENYFFFRLDCSFFWASTKVKIVGVASGGETCLEYQYLKGRVTSRILWANLRSVAETFELETNNGNFLTLREWN